jgi:hypothetical protein
VFRVVQVQRIFAAGPGSIVADGYQIIGMICEELAEDRLRRSTRFSPPVGELLEKDDPLDGQPGQRGE